MHIENRVRVSSWKYKRSFGCRNAISGRWHFVWYERVQWYKSHELRGFCISAAMRYDSRICFPCFYWYRNSSVGGTKVARGTVLLDLMRTCSWGGGFIFACIEALSVVHKRDWD